MEGSMTLPTFTANQLRFAAEGADSIRDGPAVLVVDEKGELQAVRASDVRAGQTPVLQLATESRGPGMHGEAKARIFWRGRDYGSTIEHFDKADALFLNQSAVEKFILPYYMRFRSAAKVQALENDLYNDAGVVAAFHIPGSITYPIEFGYLKPEEGTDKVICKMI
jgi:hypothetical protein